ncbi:protein phosphatase 1 regulatory subunit 35-like [Chelonoidis abingdonii]|uniref:protein phosphatase 1 regulatory subunit 35-like n=1 Tax=Chelonoidis abingdonii TaxID=106734 RepID=UPI003F491954
MKGHSSWLLKERGQGKREEQLVLLKEGRSQCQLALGEEVQAAAHQGAQELLAMSFLTHCSVEGKEAAGLNIPRAQQLYQGLVSLQVPAEVVLSCALQEKLSLVRSQPEPSREPALEGLDLLMFYEPQELFVETPYLGVEGLPPLRLQPHI